VSEPAAAPMRPRQHDATRAEQRAGKKKTSARRSPATSAASGASRGRRRRAAVVAQLRRRRGAREDARKVFAATFRESRSRQRVARELGYPDKNDRALAAVRQAVLDLVGEKVIVEAGKGRGGHPRASACVDTSRCVRADVEPAELVDRIVEVLEVDGGRVARLDLKARVGDPDFDEFGSRSTC
jgi:hypothetical protein